MTGTKQQDKWESQREEAQTIPCPVCNQDIKPARFGVVNDVYFCEKCRLVKVVRK